MLLLLTLACGPSAPPPPPDCVAALEASAGIDVSAEPRACDVLTRAVEPLGPKAREAIQGLVVVRDSRGPCGDACPDVASAVLSDGTLAWYRVSKHELHLPDAFVDGPKWSGGAPSGEALQAYLAGLGIGWSELVARVRSMPGVTLPSLAPDGAPEVFDAIVKAGPKVLLGGEVPRVDLLRHELAHVVLLHADGESERIAQWASLSDWRDAEGERADGYVGGMMTSERPIVASRLALGLDRGDCHFRPVGKGLPTGYAAFDPVEDHAESLRLFYADPVALGQRSPEKLLVLATDGTDLRDAKLRRFIEPGVGRLLDGTVDPMLAMSTLRALGPALLPEASVHANPEPLPVPEDLHEDLKPLVGALRVEIAGAVFRPPDAAVTAAINRWDARRKDHEEFQKGIDALKGDW